MLAWMLAYLTRKPKPLSYFETHAGRALYDLAGEDARKTGEAAVGITKVRDWFADDHPYAKVLDQTVQTHGKSAYPGSPLIAGELLRFEDNLTLAELHPQENAALSDAMVDYPAQVVLQNGFEMALSRTPPEPRRGILLCDPSFEVKSDYTYIPDFFAKIHRKWPVGILTLWYPILTDGRHKQMLSDLNRNIQDGTTHEVQFPPAREGHGMIGSGLFVVNAPYGFEEEASLLSQKFAKLTK